MFICIESLACVLRILTFNSQEDLNVIIVDWGHGAGIPYTQATANTRVVGAYIAKLIQELSTVGPSLADFHIIGHSLGAHIAGYAGERLKTLGQITGILIIIYLL